MRSTKTRQQKVKIRYGYTWELSAPEWEIERTMIQRGGRHWNKDSGHFHGLPLLEHYKNLQLAIWPEEEIDPWAEMALASFLANKITVLVGCKDSGKTQGMAKFALCDWWCFPDETLWLISSTTIKDAQRRVWGRIKSLFNRAKRRWPGLPGRPLEYLHSIINDQDCEKHTYATEIDKGLVLVPCKAGGDFVGLSCFPASTPVDTPSGPVAIESIRPGDTVVSAIGPRRVRATSVSLSRRLVRLHFVGGRTLDCTPNHPFLTTAGWMHAIDIPAQTKILSSHESLQIMREESQRTRSEILQSQVQDGCLGEALPTMRKEVHPIGSQNRFLFETLCSEIELGTSWVPREGDGSGFCRDGTQSESDDHGQSKGAEAEGQKSARTTRKRSVKDHQEKLDYATRKWRESLCKLWHSWTKPHRIGVYAADAGSEVQSRHPFSKISLRRISAFLPTGFLLPRDSASNRIGRRNTHTETSNRTGQTQGRRSEEAWVDRVEILESTGDERFDKNAGGYQVHNLEVEGHPSFCVVGLVTHNSFIGVKAKRLRHAGDEVSLMPDGFLNAYNNFTGESKDFKGIMAGNPTDLLDSLCKAAIPVGGWETFSDTKKTMVWRSGFFDANVINYDGRDTPNNLFPDTPAVRFPHLISRRDVESIVRSNRDDSWITFMQAYGKPNRLLASKRVITQLICDQGKAFDLAVWKGGGRTSVYGVDPAYGGGDLCIGIAGEFGEDIDGKIILRVSQPEIIPISVTILKEADDQIAEWVQTRLMELNIPSDHCYYGAFGKGTLGYAFSKIFKSRCPIPIDEGGMPTKRAVRDGLTVTEQDNSKRPMRCDEYYDRRISQLWYDTRLCIESAQLRELPKSVMDEGCLRVFKIVKGNKVSVETKEELKKRMQGESPNKFDALTFMVAGALMRGFKLAKLGGDALKGVPDDKYKLFEKDAEERYEARRQLQTLH